jgi:hypothetical protein
MSLFVSPLSLSLRRQRLTPRCDARASVRKHLVSILGLLDMLTAAPPRERERKRGRERLSLDPLRPASAPVAVGGSTASCTSRGRANRGRATAKEGEAAAEVQAMSLIKEEGRSSACGDGGEKWGMGTREWVGDGAEAARSGAATDLEEAAR